jgi:hypothetical protein
LTSAPATGLPSSIVRIFRVTALREAFAGGTSLTPHDQYAPTVHSDQHELTSAAAYVVKRLSSAASHARTQSSVTHPTPHSELRMQSRSAPHAAAALHTLVVSTHAMQASAVSGATYEPVTPHRRPHASLQLSETHRSTSAVAVDPTENLA